MEGICVRKRIVLKRFTDLPYSYLLDDPAELADIVAGSSGAGAGVLTWAKTNWLRTSY